MIKLRNISKSFNDKSIISNLNLEIQYGEKIAIMGKSGTGKTTLLNIIMGLVSPDSGIISGVPKSKSMVFQENRLLDDFSAYDNIKLVCNTDKEIILQHFEELGLSGEEDKLAGEYSGGMKRRLAIIRAVLAEPELIVMDEAFKGLDKATKNIVIDYVYKYTQNKTCVFVTHDKSEAISLQCNRIIEI